MSWDEELVPPQRGGTTRLEVYLVIEVILGPELDVPVAARLRYGAHDPYTVHLDNHVELPDPVSWMLSRELLLAGLDGPAGVGDISLWPGPEPEGDSVFLTLHGEEESVLLRLPAGTLRAFLRMTECVVPLGLEREHLDLDAVVERLLDEET